MKVSDFMRPIRPSDRLKGSGPRDRSTYRTGRREVAKIAFRKAKKGRA